VKYKIHGRGFCSLIHPRPHIHTPSSSLLKWSPLHSFQASLLSCRVSAIIFFFASRYLTNFDGSATASPAPSSQSIDILRRQTNPLGSLPGVPSQVSPLKTLHMRQTLLTIYFSQCESQCTNMESVLSVGSLHFSWFMPLIAFVSSNAVAHPQPIR